MPPDSDWLDRLAAWLPPWPLVAASAAGLLALAVVALFVRYAGIRRVAVAVAGTIGIVTSAEGMWIVAGKLPGVSGVWQAIPAVLFESAMLATAARARQHHKDHRHVGKFGPRMWTFAFAAGVIAGFAGVTIATVLLRFAAPMVAAAVVLDEFPDQRDDAAEADTITWKLGLRRLAVRFGFAKAGASNLSDEERDHRIHKLAVAADRFHHGWKLTQRWRRFRLRRLARYADDAMVARVRERVQRIHLIETSTAPVERESGDPHVPALPQVGPGSVLVQLPVEAPRVTNGNGATKLAAVAVAERMAPRAKRHPGRPSTDEEIRRVAEHLRRHPDATGREVAEALGLELRTAQRHIKNVKEQERQ